MDKGHRIAGRFAAWKRRLHRTRLECRECGAVCERVISPQHCLDSGCTSVYLYVDDDTTMFGCIHKVFAPELDRAAFSASNARGRNAEQYGNLRLNRAPRRQCRVTVEQAYPGAANAPTCSNPTFFHHPQGAPEEGIRLTSNLSTEAQAPDG